MQFLSHHFCGSGIQAQLIWLLCFWLSQAVVHVCTGLWSHQRLRWGGIASKLTEVIGRIHFLAVVGLQLPFVPRSFALACYIRFHWLHDSTSQLARERLQEVVILGVIPHHFCPILLVRGESQVLSPLRDRILLEGMRGEVGDEVCLSTI